MFTVMIKNNIARSNSDSLTLLFPVSIAMPIFLHPTPETEYRYTDDALPDGFHRFACG